jgi:hypothetical protein
MRAVVVDTNVAVVANGRSEQASPDCVLRCVDELRKVVERVVLVLDDAMHILNEYKRHLSFAGQPGAGDAFFKWVWNNQANPKRCEMVRLTPRGRMGDDFEEFPNDPALSGFDPADRKFAAVAHASRRRPAVLNAVDSDWYTFQKPLRRHGIRVRQLCPEDIKRGA